MITKQDHKTQEKYVYRTPQGTYKVSVLLTNPRTGKRVRRSAQNLPTLQAAIQVREELVAEIRGEQVQAPARPILSGYAADWVERRAEWLSPAAARTYRRIIKHYIIPPIGDIYIDVFERRDVLDWVRWAEARTSIHGQAYADQTLKKWYRVLVTMLKDMAADHQLPDPTRRVRPPSSSRRRVRETRTLTMSQLARVIDAAREHTPKRYAEVLTMAYTGMRSGEVWALHWDDLDDYSAHVHQTVSDGRIKDTTKTGYERHAYLPQVVRDAIAAHRLDMIRRQHRGLSSGLVFPSRDGTPRLPGSMRKPMDKIAKKAGIEQRLGPQVLRRTFNTLMVEAGVDRLVLRSQMGHSDEEMTAHYFDGHLEQKQEVIERVFEGVV